MLACCSARCGSPLFFRSERWAGELHIARAQFDEAQERIENGTYGYCEETGEPISLKRLDARPIATLSIEVGAKAGIVPPTFDSPHPAEAGADELVT